MSCSIKVAGRWGHGSKEVSISALAGSIALQATCRSRGPFAGWRGRQTDHLVPAAASCMPGAAVHWPPWRTSRAPWSPLRGDCGQRKRASAATSGRLAAGKQPGGPQTAARGSMHSCVASPKDQACAVSPYSAPSLRTPSPRVGQCILDGGHRAAGLRGLVLIRHEVLGAVSLGACGRGGIMRSYKRASKPSCG